MFDLNDTKGFEWDERNLNKNYSKHGVLNKECEEVFKNSPLFVNHDQLHSTQNEQRYQALGMSDKARKIFISFTVRKNKIRIISARNMSKNERKNRMANKLKKLKPAFGGNPIIKRSHIKKFGSSISSVPPISKNKSFHSGFSFSINLIFHFLFHFLICFSLLMAILISLVCSYCIRSHLQ